MITGGAGFIGSNFVLHWLRQQQTPVVNLDALTYAGNLQNLQSVWSDERHVFVHGNINDRELLDPLLQRYEPRAVVHFAAESHVDRSVAAPDSFISTNVCGTFSLLQATRQYWQRLPDQHRRRFRFLHISTDEVYGSLAPEGPPFTETTPYAPNNPYSASKAAADHMVRAYHRTYGLPTLTINCSNNYGPHQFPEKLIPLAILNASEGRPIPVYGDGLNVRDWLYVEDHCQAIALVLAHGRPGESYNVGGSSELSNLQLVQRICALLDELSPRSLVRPHSDLITFVADRPGHDWRYAMDTRKIERDLDWRPSRSLEAGLRRTVQWYLEKKGWVAAVRDGAYRTLDLVSTLDRGTLGCVSATSHRDQSWTE